MKEKQDITITLEKNNAVKITLFIIFFYLSIFIYFLLYTFSLFFLTFSIFLIVRFFYEENEYYFYLSVIMFCISFIVFYGACKRMFYKAEKGTLHRKTSPNEKTFELLNCFDFFYLLRNHSKFLFELWSDGLFKTIKFIIKVEDPDINKGFVSINMNIPKSKYLKYIEEYNINYKDYFNYKYYLCLYNNEFSNYSNEDENVFYKNRTMPFLGKFFELYHFDNFESPFFFFSPLYWHKKSSETYFMQEKLVNLYFLSEQINRINKLKKVEEKISTIYHFVYINHLQLLYLNYEFPDLINSFKKQRIYFVSQISFNNTFLNVVEIINNTIK